MQSSSIVSSNPPTFSTLSPNSRYRKETLSVAMETPATDTEVASADQVITVAVYVGDLHPDVLNENLKELFSTMGPVQSVRVCRDFFTGVSRGYGYVNYIYKEDAIKAIEELNHTVLCGMPIRVMWSRYDPESRNNGVGNLFVKNLSASIDAVKLREMFSKFGTIVSCKVVCQDGKSKGFGFVQFDSQDSANAAIENLNGTTVDGKQIYVGIFIKKSERVLPDPELSYTNIYMKNLDSDITKELIELKFSEFGKIINVAIEMDEEGNSKGFGFVNFVNPDSAKMAVEIMNGLQLGSKKLYVARAQTKEERKEFLRQKFEDQRIEEMRKNTVSNLYVKNIDDSVDDDVLWEHFSQCGTITSAKVMRDDNGISKGFGFVCFSTEDEAVQALNSLHGSMFHGKPLYVAIAQRKEERQAQLLLQHSQRIAKLSNSAADANRNSTNRQNFLCLESEWKSSQVLPQIPFPLFLNNTRHRSPKKDVLNSHVPLKIGHTIPHIPHLPHRNHSFNYLMDLNGQQANSVYNGRLFASSSSQEAMLLSSMLAAAPPQEQKQILGQRLFPMIRQIKGDLASKITGMLLEMDNSELLVLLDSPKALASKVEEAFHVLNVAKARAAGQDAVSSSFLSAQIAVN